MTKDALDLACGHGRPSPKEAAARSVIVPASAFSSWRLFQSEFTDGFRYFFTVRCGFLIGFSSAHSSHTLAAASLGMRQSPRGDKLMVPTFGPSGKHDRLH